MKQGYLYCETGDKFIREAIISAISLKRCNSNAHITLITNEEIENKTFDSIIIKKNRSVNSKWKLGVQYKVESLLLSPYEKTFFIDTDTYFIEDSSELFELLEYYDLQIAHAPDDKNKVVLDDKKLDGYYPYNTGVIVFNNNSKIKNFFQDWLTIYKAKFDIYPHDQTPFMEALLLNDIKLHVFHQIYNFRLPFYISIPGLSVKILHGRTDDFEIIAKKINKHYYNRVWVSKKTVILNKPKKTFKSTLISLMPINVKNFLKKLINSKASKQINT